MQSINRATKRGSIGFRHMIATKNKKGRARRTQIIILSKVASDANQRLTKTITHSVI